MADAVAAAGTAVFYPQGLRFEALDRPIELQIDAEVVLQERFVGHVNAPIFAAPKEPRLASGVRAYPA